MGNKVKNKDDIVQYCIRLNLSNPDHLLIHQTLQHINKGIHKSQNNFIIESVVKNIQNSNLQDILERDELEDKLGSELVTRAELEEMEKRVQEKVMKEILSLVFSSHPVRGIASTNISEPKPLPDANSVQEDETLKELAMMWSD